MGPPTMSIYPDVLPLSFYDRDPVTVARDLLGKLLVHEHDGHVTAGVIVETEAYLAANDPASHAARGRTARNTAMFGPPGRAYIYALHRHHCLNVVTEEQGVPSAVLLRAVEPLVGIPVMQTRRHTAHHIHLTSGPGKLCEAFAIDRSLDQWDVTQGQRLWVAVPQSGPPREIAVTARIGVTSARELPLRFFVSSSPFVSRRPRGRVASRGTPRQAERFRNDACV
jgi:DNA-3-methyladenine glycosylase